MPVEVFWSVFLSLMVPIVNTLDEKSLFVFPEDIPKYVAETWINFHSAKKITVYPISEEKSINPSKLMPKKDSKYDRQYEAAVLYGGGKDSIYAYSVLSEILGTENVLIISFVYSWSQDAILKVDKRRDNFMLNPLRKDINSKIQKIISDFAAILTDFKKIHTPNVSIYTGPALPVLMKYRIHLLTHTNEFLSYRINNRESNYTDFNFKRSRPEYDDYLSERTNNYYNTNFAVKNLSYFLSGPAAFKIISERYPHMLKHISMCESIGNPNKRWCQNCHKCAEYVLYSLCYKYDQQNISTYHFFTDGQYIQNLLKNSKNLKPLTHGHQNCSWTKFFSVAGHYESLSHVIASIDPEYVRRRTSDKGFSNFLKLKSKYGNRKFPLHESLIEPAFRQLNLPYAEKIKKIVLHHCKEIKDPIIQFYRGEGLSTVDYNIKCKVLDIFNENQRDDYVKQIDKYL